MAPLTLKPRSRRRASAELEELVRGAIRRGELKPGDRLGSAKQLAKEWNSSYGTVRQTLETLAAKGLVERKPRAGTFVSGKPETAETNGGARDIIGLLVPDIRLPECCLIARHLQDAGHNAHFEVLVSSTDNDRSRYDQSIARHLKAGVGGLVLASPHHGLLSLQTLVEIEKSGVPVVNYGRVVDVVNWTTVQTDVFQAAYLPVRHLCELGCRRIAFLTYPAPDLYSTQMHYGLYRAILESGLTVDNVVEFPLPDEAYLNGWADTQALTQVLNKWLDENPKVDAICCMHEHIAATLLSVLAQRGVRVPDDLAITGSGAMPEFFGLAPGELTTVDTRIDAAAMQIVQVLQRGHDRNAERPPAVIAVQPRLVIGRSTVPGGRPEVPGQVG
jgi:DNA-binding LacI/PurR family transcriptional regulator